MRVVAHGSVYFQEQDRQRVKELMVAQCSAIHMAYQFTEKTKIHGNDVKKHVKETYMQYLNQRYISDACVIAESINHPKVIFGGKKNWKKLITGSLRKEEWRESRFSQLYSTGDRTKKGNPNIRIVDDELWVNDPSGRGLWIRGKLFLPDKFKAPNKINRLCYDARLKNGKEAFAVTFSSEFPNPEIVSCSVMEGCVGIDTNPDGVALAEIDRFGNILHHHYIKGQRLVMAGRGKRDYDTRLLAKEVVDYALSVNKPVVIEQLNFGRKKAYRKFNRMSHNFCYRRILQAIYSRAVRNGIEVIEVNPAFTSIIGALKFQHKWTLNRHISAAWVIARRGQGRKEKLEIRVTKTKSRRKPLNLEGRGGICQSMTKKSYSYLCQLAEVKNAHDHIVTVTPTGTGC